MSFETNPELGERVGYTVGETVEMATDHWEGAVASKGEHGKIARFAFDGRDIFAYVTFPNDETGMAFPLLPDEIKKVEAGE
ncbi:hypothetical protein [Streptomyces collinus]|uniref:hypothetical protein n=1 Tax=Streptomyces collinus TaxID=42684 RepID=UPI0037BA047F